MLFGRLKPCVCFISFSLQIWNHHSLHRMKWKQYETVSQIIPAVQSCHSFKLQLPLCNLVCQVQRLSIGPSRLAKQTTEKRRKTEKEEKKEKKGKSSAKSLWESFCRFLSWSFLSRLRLCSGNSTACSKEGQTFESWFHPFHHWFHHRFHPVSMKQFWNLSQVLEPFAFEVDVSDHCTSAIKMILRSNHCLNLDPQEGSYKQKTRGCLVCRYKLEIRSRG